MDNKVIDMHAHLANYRIYPNYWIKGMMSNLYSFLGSRPDAEIIIDKMIKTSLNDFDCSKLIKSMDNAGISKTAIMMADFGYGDDDIELSLSEIYEEHRKNTAQYSDRIIIFAGCDPRRGKEGYDLFEKGIKEYGFQGLKLYPPCGFELDDKQLMPFYELCDYYRIPILTHVGPSLESMKKVFNFPGSLKNIIDRYRNTDFLLGHGAIQRYDECNQLPMQYDNVYLELSGFQQFISDEAGIKEKLIYMSNNYPDKIIFGTDWPLFQSQEKSVNYIEQLEYISEEQKQRILYKNAEQILNKRH